MEHRGGCRFGRGWFYSGGADDPRETRIGRQKHQADELDVPPDRLRGWKLWLGNLACRHVFQGLILPHRLVMQIDQNIPGFIIPQLWFPHFGSFFLYVWKHYFFGEQGNSRITRDCQTAIPLFYSGFAALLLSGIDSATTLSRRVRLLPAFQVRRAVYLRSLGYDANLFRQ